MAFFSVEGYILPGSDINFNDWEKWLSYSYLVFNMDATASQVKGFMAVLNGFVLQKWMKKHGTEHLPIVQKLVKELEPSVIASVKTMEAFASYQERRNKPEYGLDYLWEMFGSAPLITEDSVEGVFEIKEINDKTVNVQFLGTDSLSCSIETSDVRLSNIETGYILCGSLMKETEWKLSKAIRVFPNQAARHIETLMLGFVNQ